MTKQEIENMLYDYPDLMQSLRDDKEELRETYKSKEEALLNIKMLPGMTISSTPGTGEKSDPTPRAAEELLRLENKYDTHIKYLTRIIEDKEDQCRTTRKMLRLLSEREKFVIKLFYFRRYRWKKVSDILHYSIIQCKRIREQTLENMIRNDTK